MHMLEGLNDAHPAERAIVFVDMFGSTSMKEREPETTWIATFGWFYGQIGQIVVEGGAGTITKYLGDGMMVAYDQDDATQAINDAIRMQEAIKDAVEERHVRLHCSIGIGTGTVTEYSPDSGRFDCLGGVVDRARRLCEIASPQAIFIDTATIDAAQMNKVRSKVGHVLKRSTEDYQGDLERATLKGFGQPVPYREIRWDQQLFGVKSRAVTAALEAAPTGGASASSGGAVGSTRGEGPRGQQGQRGVVRHWNADKGHGILCADDGTVYYTDTRYLLGTDRLERSETVYFSARPTLVPGRNPVASAVVVVGEEAEGDVVAVNEGYGFVRVEDSKGNCQDLFFSTAQCSGPVERHRRVRFVVGHTERGARAEEVEALASRSEAA
jgi:class 3 adenylate cyclase/cold shock CspA family protein